ncbi:MAG: DUF1614 domain-containing protein [Firmicutes bacterium]|jgi:uncharacterized membrane protein|nr:DUF1614 domain-containing protein [Bacillota bacterium]
MKHQGKVMKHMRMPIGVVALLAVAILIYFGLAHRVLDRMRLNDRTALAFIIAFIVGGFLNVTIVRAPAELMLNIGGGLVPVALAVYLLQTADRAAERTRGTIAAIVTGAAIYGLARLLPAEPPAMLIDPLYAIGIVAGVIGYIAGRSRRGSFVAGTVGVVLADVFQYVELLVRRTPGRTWIGGAGAFDAVVIAGIIAVALSEVVGETRERLQGGPASTGGEGTRMAGMLGTPDSAGAPPPAGGSSAASDESGGREGESR